MKRALVLLLPVLLAVVGVVFISPNALADSGEFRVRAGTDDAEQQSDGTVLDSSDLGCWTTSPRTRWSGCDSPRCPFRLGRRSPGPTCSSPPTRARRRRCQ